MAASKVYSSLFASATDPTPNYNLYRHSPFGTDVVSVIYTVATTSIDEAGDFVGLWPVPAGKKWQVIRFTCPALAASALDLDIIQRSIDKDGNITDVILFNAGTAFAAAQTEVAVYPTASGGDQFPPSATGVVLIGLYCNVAATTPAAGSFKGTITYQ